MTDNNILVEIESPDTGGFNEKSFRISPVFRRVGFSPAGDREFQDLCADLYKHAKTAALSFPCLFGTSLAPTEEMSQLRLYDADDYSAIDDDAVIEAEQLRDIPPPLLPHELLTPQWMPETFWSAELAFRDMGEASFEISLDRYGAKGLERVASPWQRWRLSRHGYLFVPEDTGFRPAAGSLCLECDFFTWHWCGFERYLCLAMLEVVLRLTRVTGAYRATGYLVVDGEVVSDPVFRFVGTDQCWFGTFLYSPWHRHLRPPRRHPDERLNAELDYYEYCLLKEFPMVVLPEFPAGCSVDEKSN